MPDGRRQILGFDFPGDVLGLRRTGERVPYGAVALTEAELGVAPLDAVMKTLASSPDALMDAFTLVNRQVARAEDALLALGQRTALEKVAWLISRLYRQHGAVAGLPVNQQHMADALGLSLVHTNKTIRKLKSHGLIAMSAGRIHVRDIAAIEAVSEGDSLG